MSNFQYPNEMFLEFGVWKLELDYWIFDYFELIIAYVKIREYV